MGPGGAVGADCCRRVHPVGVARTGLIDAEERPARTCQRQFEAVGDGTIGLLDDVLGSDLLRSNPRGYRQSIQGTQLGGVRHAHPSGLPVQPQPAGDCAVDPGGAAREHPATVPAGLVSNRGSARLVEVPRAQQPALGSHPDADGRGGGPHTSGSRAEGEGVSAREPRLWGVCERPDSTGERDRPRRRLIHYLHLVDELRIPTDGKRPAERSVHRGRSARVSNSRRAGVRPLQSHRPGE